MREWLDPQGRSGLSIPVPVLYHHQAERSSARWESSAVRARVTLIKSVTRSPERRAFVEGQSCFRTCGSVKACRISDVRQESRVKDATFFERPMCRIPSHHACKWKRRSPRARRPVCHIGAEAGPSGASTPQPGSMASCRVQLGAPRDKAENCLSVSAGGLVAKCYALRGEGCCLNKARTTVRRMLSPSSSNSSKARRLYSTNGSRCPYASRPMPRRRSSMSVR